MAGTGGIRCKIWNERTDSASLANSDWVTAGVVVPETVAPQPFRLRKRSKEHERKQPRPPSPPRGSSPLTEPTFALVLSGGGARGAYEAGVMYYLRTQLPQEIAGKTLFKVYSGTSVGAINTAFLAATADDPLYQGSRLRALWQNLTSADIYRADVHALAGFLVKTALMAATGPFGMSRHLKGKGGPNGNGNPFPFRSVLDTTPFVFYLRRNVQWAALHRNVQRRVIDGVTISATHMLSGRLAMFLEKHPDALYRSGGHFPIQCALTPKHILASAAIPVVFPIIRINGQYFGDGSLQQNTPMSPPIHMGANRLLVISLARKENMGPVPVLPTGAIEPEPKVSDVLGRLLNTMFLDKLEYDLTQMRRINFLIQDIEKVFGATWLDKVNDMRRKANLPSKAVNELQKVIPFVISPSKDIGAIAYHHFAQLMRNRRALSPVHRFFAKLVEGAPDGHNDFISYLMFEHDYLNELIDLGYHDAAKEHSRLVNFFSNRDLDSPLGSA
jgi:NTE family protein